MATYEELLAKGAESVRDADKIIEKQLAKMYKEAYQFAENELAKLYATVGETIDLIEAQKYSRLENLLNTIKKEYKSLTGDVISITEVQSANDFIEGFNRVAWATDQAVGQTISWGVLPLDAIRQSVYSEVSGKNLITTFTDNFNQSFAKVKAAITRGLATGQAYSKTAEEIKTLFERAYSDAIRVVRTETTRNLSEGQLMAFDKAKDQGITVKKRWLATLDERTRLSHAVIDGEYADDDGYFHIGSAKAKAPGLFMVPELDINCRCTVVAEIVGVTNKQGRRDPTNKRDRQTGLEDIKPFQTYREWAKDKGWSDKTGWPIVKKL